MTKPTKYIRGAPFSSMDDLCAWLEADGWVYMAQKVQHPGWVISMQFRTVRSMLNHRSIYRAQERVVEAT